MMPRRGNLREISFMIRANTTTSRGGQRTPSTIIIIRNVCCIPQSLVPAIRLDYLHGTFTVFDMHHGCTERPSSSLMRPCSGPTGRRSKQTPELSQDQDTAAVETPVSCSVRADR